MVIMVPMTPNRSTELVTVATGTSSIIAICSEAATDWVVQQTGNTCYSNLSASIASIIISQLTLGKGLSSKRVPEPNFETAWMYYEGSQSISSFKVLLFY